MTPHLRLITALTSATLLLLSPTLVSAQDEPDTPDDADTLNATDDAPEVQSAPEDATNQEGEPAKDSLYKPYEPPSLDDTLNTIEQATRARKDAQRAKPTDSLHVPYFLVKDTNSPQLDYTKPILCFARGNGEPTLHVQCDADTKECLAAEHAIFRERRKGEEGDSTLVPTSQIPAETSYCYTTLEISNLPELTQRGYTLTAARLEAPYGTKRDERGRSFQSHFDLRSRLLLGVYHSFHTSPEGSQNSLSMETRSSYESYSYGKRQRFRFIEGEFTLAPFMVQGTVFDYNRGRSGDEPLLYVTELIGEPSRHDIYLNLSRGITLGRIDLRRATAAQPELLFIDLVEGRLQWELLQGLGLEDVFMFTLAAGTGTRARERGPYVYPEIGFRAVALKSPRGLFQFTTEGRMRYAFEPVTGTSWLAATAAADLEWVAIALSDQPVSLYIRPSADFIEFLGESGSVRELQVVSGIRLSLFTPRPPHPMELSRDAEVY